MQIAKVLCKELFKMVRGCLEMMSSLIKLLDLFLFFSQAKNNVLEKETLNYFFHHKYFIEIILKFFNGPAAKINVYKAAQIKYKSIYCVSH